MNELKRLIQQAALAVAVAVIGVAALLPTVLAPTASADQVLNRSITMSTSAASATASYTVAFKAAAAATGLVVDFCSNDPLYNDSCDFSAATVPTVAATLTTSSGTGTGIGSGTPKHTVQITGLSITAGGNFTVTISAGITNPTGVGTFYARILTYNSAPNYSPASTTGGSVTPGSFVDYGGDALSTVNNISITAKVFETLSFCVYTGSCGTGPTLKLGDPTTGALSTSNAYVNADAKFDLATNAGSGVSVVMRGTTLCDTTGAACQSGTASSNTITPVSSTPTAFNTAGTKVGTEMFGMCADKNSSAALTVDAAYTDSVASCHGLTTGILSTANTFGWNNTAVTGATGSEVVASTGAVPAVTGGGFAFAANIAPTTEAGIYTTSLNMVATSTY